MVLGTAPSRNNIPVRLTSERLLHITTAHPELNVTDVPLILKTVENPDMVLEGDFGQKISGLW